MLVTLLVIALILAAVWGLTRYQRIAKTKLWITELASEDHGKAMAAMDLLAEQGLGAPAFLHTAVSKGVPRARWRAAQLLGELGEPQDVNHLLPLLSAPDSSVRAAAALALGKLDAAEALQSLLGLATQQDEDLAVRCAACRALALLGAVESVKSLTELVKERGEMADEETPDEKWQLRVDAAAALGLIAAPDAAKALGEAAMSQEEPVAAVRVAAAYALGDMAIQLRSDDDLSHIITSLIKAADDENGDVRAAAVYSLARIDIPQGDADRVQAILSKAEADPGYWVREAAQAAKKGFRR